VRNSASALEPRYIKVLRGHNLTPLTVLKSLIMLSIMDALKATLTLKFK